MVTAPPRCFEKEQRSSPYGTPSIERVNSHPRVLAWYLLMNALPPLVGGVCDVIQKLDIWMDLLIRERRVCVAAAGSAGLPPNRFLISATFRGILLAVRMTAERCNFTSTALTEAHLTSLPLNLRSPLSCEAAWDQIELEMYGCRWQLPSAKLETSDRRRTLFPRAQKHQTEKHGRG